MEQYLLYPTTGGVPVCEVPFGEGIICSCINLDLHYLYCWLKSTLTGRDGLGPGKIWVAVMPHLFLGPLPCPITIPHLPTVTYAMYGW